MTSNTRTLIVATVTSIPVTYLFVNGYIDLLTVGLLAVLNGAIMAMVNVRIENQQQLENQEQQTSLDPSTDREEKEK